MRLILFDPYRYDAFARVWRRGRTTPHEVPFVIHRHNDPPLGPDKLGFF